MVIVYMREGSRFVTATLSELLATAGEIDIVWMDMVLPTPDEIRSIEGLFDIRFPTKHEREEIEHSSRYWEDSRSIMINAYFFVSFFFVDESKAPYNETVSFILQENILFTVRDKELHTFETVQKRITTHPKEVESGYDIFMQIFDVRIDADADLLEYAAKESDAIRKRLLREPGNQTVETLRKIATLQEFTLKIRQSVFDKQRILTSLARSQKLSKPIKEELAIMMKDVNSLVEFTTIDINTLDNLQNLFLAQINIEQNKIIKLFTVASVALMPPTLIASVYGMNFRFIPELGWNLGYPMSLFMMAVSGAVPLIFFRRKGWL